MTCDFQEELPVASCVDELVLGGASEGYAAENERSGMVGKLLLPVLTLLSNKGDCLEMSKPELGNAEGWGRGPYRRKRRKTATDGP
jgi:hypothetical protein